jgi:RES domain-containing protein
MVDIDPVAVTGHWFHHAPHGVRPRLDPPRDAAPDGRWQRGEIATAFYVADSPDTAWAEWYRRLAEFALSPSHDLPRDLWRCSLQVTVADLSTPERLNAVGLDRPTPGRESWPAYQRVGEQLRAQG